MERALDPGMTGVGGLETLLSPEEQRRLTTIIGRFAARISEMEPQEAAAHIEERVNGLQRLYMERYGGDPIGLLHALQVVLGIRTLIYETLEGSRPASEARRPPRAETRPVLMTRPRVPVRPSAKAS